MVAGGTPSKKDASYWEHGTIKWLGSTVCQNQKNIENQPAHSRDFSRESLQYHLVWCTKYRKQVLVGNIETEFKRQLQLVMDELPGTIMEMEVMPDHVHLLVDCSPQFFIPDAIKRLKGQTAKKLFELFPDIKKSLWGGHLWNPSYCAVSVSDRSIEQVKQYIREQKPKE